jgi:hypothetical protein
VVAHVPAIATGRPALNNDTALSRPRMPEWLDKDIGRVVEDQEEQEEIAAGFE